MRHWAGEGYEAPSAGSSEEGTQIVIRLLSFYFYLTMCSQIHWDMMNTWIMGFKNVQKSVTRKYLVNPDGSTSAVEEEIT